MSAPAVLRRLLALLVLEGVALVVLGLVYAVAGATGAPEDRLAVELAALLAVGAGALLLVMARATGQARTWPRSPVVVLNVIALPVALGLLQGHVWLVGVPLLLLAGTVLYTFATPDAREALQEG